MYYKRLLEDTLNHYLKLFPVVAVTGPRQSGKSTMLINSFAEKYRYISFDDFRITSLFYDDPERFINIYNERIIFDEVQKIPEIFQYLKLVVDNNRDDYGRFILTGSSQLNLMVNISESLAGRIRLLRLFPFQYSEIPENLRYESLYRGTYPEIIKRKYAGSEEWYSSYIETYLEKDLRQITNIGDYRDFRRFLKLLAANTAQILNLSNFGKDIGVSVSTIKRWLSVLEASFIIFILPPYYENFGKRVIKSPKVYFYDTGIVSYLTGISSRDVFENGPMAGAIFENYIISEIIKKELHSGNKAEFYYYRTNHGDEIDLVIDKLNTKTFIEIKNSFTFKPKMLKLLKELPIVKGILLYRGEDIPYSETIEIKNYNNYLSG